MNWILVVTIFTVQNGWIVKSDTTERQAPSQQVCERMKQHVDTKMKAAKGSQYMVICRPDRTAA